MNRLRATFCSLCLTLTLGTISYAQEGRDRHPVPGKDYILEPFERYGDVSWEHEQATLDSFAIELQNDPRLVGYIIVYAGRVSCASEAQHRGLRAKKYLVEYRHIAWDRVIWKDAGHLERPYVMLWGQVRGAKPYPFSQPEPLPLTEVKVKDCRTRGDRRKKRGRM